MAFPATYEIGTAYTIPEEISASKRIEMSHGNMQFKTRLTEFSDLRHLVVPHQSLIGQFRYILNRYIFEREFSEEEQKRYYQKPKLLSMELYNTQELWSWLMYINNCKSVANFTFPKSTLLVFVPNIDKAIKEIMTIYNKDITANKKEVYPSNF